MDYQQAIAFLESFIDYEKQRGAMRYETRYLHIERFKRFLEQLGSPQRDFKIIHLAGTKGKGSTAAILHSILARAGIPSGMFSSPHLHSYCERIRINGHPVSTNEFAKAMAEVRQGFEAFAPDSERVYRTAFELMTAAAFVAFRQAGVKWGIIETGLGGRLDATNVVDPNLVILTRIGYDHSEILGDTLEKITREKCGIIKEGSRVILSPQTEGGAGEIETIVTGNCSAMNASLTLVDHKYRIALHKIVDARQHLEIENSRSGQKEWLVSPLIGRHQADNILTARCAIDALREMGEAIDDEALREGVRETSWPGRFEIIHSRPAIILDAAHCQISLKALADTVEEYSGRQQPVFIIGMTREKNPTRLLNALFSTYPAADVFVVPLPSPRGMSPNELAGALKSAFPSLSIHFTPDMRMAVQEALGIIPDDGVIVVCGSMYHLEPARQAVQELRKRA